MPRRPFRGKPRVIATANRLVGADGPIWTNLRNGRMRLDMRVPLENAAFWNRGIDDRAITRLREAIVEGAVVLDIGANIGLFAVPLGRAALAQGGRLIAFEPMPMSAARLRENLAANNVAATVLEVALGAEDGTAEMAPMEPGETANAAFVERATGSSTTVKVMRLDEIAAELALHRCDVVKVDVEGGELAVLRGGATFLEHHQPLIYLELNDPRMEAMGWKESELLELARSWGYEVFVETGEGFERFRRTGPMDNILLVRK